MTVIWWILGLLIFAIVLALSIGLHELGHAKVAKKFGLKVPKFFIGFGPKIWSKEKNGTEYGVRAIPLGGFVQIIDDTVEKTETHKKLEEDYNNAETNYKNVLKKFKKSSFTEKKFVKTEVKESKKALSHATRELRSHDEVYINEHDMLAQVSPWKRILIFAAGPMVNIGIGVGILLTMLMIYPVNVVGTTINTVNICSEIDQKTTACSANEAGLKDNDKIISINNKKVNDGREITKMISESPDKKADFIVERDGIEKSFTNVPLNDKFKVGINMTKEQKSLSFFEANETLYNLTLQNLNAIAELPSKAEPIIKNIMGAEKDPESPSSVIAVGKNYGDTVAGPLDPQDKLQTLLMYSGLFNFGLGLINFIPFFPLDGSKILISLMDSLKILWSKITRRMYNPTSMSTIQALTVITIVPLVCFMGIVMFSDIVNIGRGSI